MRIRDSTPRDVDELLEMRLSLFQESGESISAAERLAVLEANRPFFEASSTTCKTWVAEFGTAVVGAGTLSFFIRPPYPGNLSGKEAYLLNMYTKPQYRRRGVAKAVLRTALAYASENGFGKVWLHATDAGRPIYQAAGFVPAPTYMEYEPGNA